MSFLKDRALVFAIILSDALAEKGCYYEAYTNLNKSIMKKFSRMGMIKAMSYMFQIIDECSAHTHVFLKHSFVNTAYQDAAKMALQVKRQSQMHFWAGCIKICQFRNEAQLSVLKRLENLMKARQHLQFTVNQKPKHILAPYLLTACDNSFRDISGTVPYPENVAKTPNQYYNQANSREELFLLLSFILGKLTFYVDQYYESECYLNMVLCQHPSSAFEDQISHKALMLLNRIAALKAKKAKESTK